ncbi:anaerobic ribonucleoside-triphosphate reductase activating protein [Rheinheimera sp. 4Y26]|uniref:anaerobic ribonucleoside-triphosphate reductase activating protein n=1 Tax=Rheinheimera sp. 4Y26 TaxID=2977811 RepID=UPI0021B1333D|nr:anaerobic ribonucleoside-triphosphate reductase activating protein [Rheinheimera sp. 4Y26]MCT6701212.1 anaerobic ribonucleoside-triphosphate reductase activating protein [Rheinheimera sp. 4Y26]
MPDLYYYAEQVVWQEVPGETSLAFTISGCPLGCKGCHSAQSWPATAGLPLSPALLLEKLNQYRGLISCVLFLGGEWQPKLLQQLLQLCKKQGLKTCLYTGLEIPPPGLLPLLDYIKTGRWQAELGPLGTPGSNQRFYDLNLLQEQSWKFQQDSTGKTGNAARANRVPVKTIYTDQAATEPSITAETAAVNLKTTQQGLLSCND